VPGSGVSLADAPKPNRSESPVANPWKFPSSPVKRIAPESIQSPPELAALKTIGAVSDVVLSVPPLCEAVSDVGIDPLKMETPDENARFSTVIELGVKTGLACTKKFAAGSVQIAVEASVSATAGLNVTVVAAFAALKTLTNPVLVAAT